MLKSTRRNGARGFTLVEMMVALVAGLIVVGAVIALIASIMKSNRQTIQSTRLNQEMRATMAVLAGDMRRARGVDDPLTTATQATKPYATIDTSTAGCAVYAYSGGGGGDCRVVRLINGAIWQNVAAPSGGACTLTCNDAASGTKLGSDQVVLTSLQFSPSSTSTSTRQYEVQLQGHLVDEDTSLATISRTITQTVFVRSVGQ
jgi:Tfp pilus assembly protein PilW